MLLLLLHYFEIKQQKNTTNNSKLLWQQKKTENTHALTHALHTWMCRASHKWDGHLAETNRNTFFFDQVFNQVCIMNGTVCGSKNVCVWSSSCVVCSSYWNFFLFCITFFIAGSFLPATANLKYCINRIVNTLTHLHTHQSIIPFAMPFSIFK